MLADRAKQCLDEPAMATAAHYQQVSSGRRVQQRAGRVASHHHRPDRGRLTRAGHLGDGGGEGLRGAALHVQVGHRSHRIPVVNGDIPGDKRLHHRAG